MSSPTARHRGLRLAAALGAVALSAASVVLPSTVNSAEGGHGVVAATAPSGSGDWVGTWSAGPVIPGDSGEAYEGFEDATVRNVVHTSVSGRKVRVRLTNLYGEAPLTIDDATVARRSDGAALLAGTVRDLTFGGKGSTTIPVGAEVVSDPVRLRVRAGADLAVSTYFDDPTGPVTQHPVATSTNYSSTDGNQAATVEGDSYDTTSESWYVLDGVDVRNPAHAGSVVAFGDSITDGNESTIDANRRWPDYLARRLDDTNRAPLGVLNQGISGNRVLNDADTRGRSAQARFDNDVLSQTGVRTVVITEGINDIRYLEGPNGEPLTADLLTDGIHNLVRRAHAHGLTAIGGTLLPYGGSDRFTEEGERIRQQVNEWIRTSDVFDAVVDFDKVTRDPDDPTRMAPAYDSGDHLHPSDAGYEAMADAIPIRRLY